MAFLQVLTRCYQRPEMLTANIRSLLEQTDPDWEQTCLVDSQGRGIGWSYENLAAHARPIGKLAALPEPVQFLFQIDGWQGAVNLNIQIFHSLRQLFRGPFPTVLSLAHARGQQNMPAGVFQPVLVAQVPAHQDRDSAALHRDRERRAGHRVGLPDEAAARRHLQHALL